MGDQEVRRSIVRISFDWEPSSKEKRVMVIAGIILSVGGDGFAVIAADSTFFGKLPRKMFKVNFPNASGYEDEQKLNVFRNPKQSVVLGPYEYAEGFYIFTAKPKEKDYIKAVRFETQPVKAEDPVYSFVFPREAHITPTCYCRGTVKGVGLPVIFHNCDMHEYGYLGSPLFNESGDLVGITYLDQGYLQAWTVWQLQYTFRDYFQSIVFVSNGKEAAAGGEAAATAAGGEAAPAAAGGEAAPAAAGGEAQVEGEESAGAEAQVEEENI